jgi:type IV pilus assembly protein PilV
MDGDKVMKNSKFQIPNSKLRKFSICNSQAGLTLVEVLVALTILSVGLLGVALMQITSISGNTFSREMAVATELGQDMLEKLNALSYEDTAITGSASPGTAHPTATDVSNGLAVGAGTNNIIDERGLTVGPTIYTRTWNVIDNAPATNMKTITVTVSWTEKGATLTTRSITIIGVKVQS